MSWGHTWGNNWGGCSAEGEQAEGFFVVSAKATSSKTYVVEFSQAPLIASPIGPNDAANTANVELVRLDTGEVIQLLAAGSIAGQPLLVEYLLLGSFTSAQIVYETRHQNLVNIFDDPLVDPKTAQFDGMPAASELRDRTQALIDYFNPQADGELMDGGLVVATNADYEFEGGASLLRKLIIRRVITAQDEFFHLSDREYGLGIRPKNTYTEPDLVQFQRQLEREVRKEPEVSAAKATILIKPDHELIITVRAKLRTTDQQIEVSVPVDFTSRTAVSS